MSCLIKATYFGLKKHDCDKKGNFHLHDAASDSTFFFRSDFCSATERPNWIHSSLWKQLVQGCSSKDN